jgi:hypothetical protein
MSIGSFGKSITSAGQFESTPRKITCVADTISDSVGICFEPKITPCPVDRHLRSMTIAADRCHPPIKSGDRHFRIML